jgi:hypothetical protein
MPRLPTVHTGENAERDRQRDAEECVIGRHGGTDCLTTRCVTIAPSMAMVQFHLGPFNSCPQQYGPMLPARLLVIRYGER